MNYYKQLNATYTLRQFKTPIAAIGVLNFVFLFNAYLPRLFLYFDKFFLIFDLTEK